MRPTWIPGLAVGTPIVAGHGGDQILQRPLVARLLTLAQGRHGCSFFASPVSSHRSLHSWDGQRGNAGTAQALRVVY